MYGHRSLLALLLFCPLAGAAEWPQWLGPTRDGVSPETVAPWKGDLKVVWKQPVGEGNSSPIVAGGRVFIHAKVKDKDQEEVTAFDAKTGKEQWRTSYPRTAITTLFGNGPRATPAVAGDRVYTFGLTGVLTCFDTANGKQVWQIDTLEKFQADNLFFGTSCSPLVDGKRVLVNVGGKGASIVAFDKDKGDVLWKSQDDKASYASPILIDPGKGRRQAVFLTHEGVVSLDPGDGSLLWRYPLTDALAESSTTPVRSGDLLLASSITFGSVGLHLEMKNDKPAAHEKWKNAALTCYFSTPLPVGTDHIYLVTGTKPPALKVEATLRCVETATGKELWQKPRVGKYHASLLRTGNDKLLMLDDAGNLILLDPSPREYRELARAKVCGQTWAHPALADGKFYVRDENNIICLQLSE
jgi:outer membrane protein assembly factor BamB